MAKKKHTFNGKEVTEGTKKKKTTEKREFYKLVGSKPPVHVEKSTVRGKTYFFVSTYIPTSKGRKSRQRIDGRPARRWGSYNYKYYRGFGRTLPLALRNLEKTLNDTFAALAKQLGYDLEE